jgi:multidrug transporter EmrE-like cation transporter
MSSAAALALAFLAYSLLGAGLVMMKKGIGWLGWRGPRDGRFVRTLAVWVAGFLLMNLYIVPAAVALKRLDSHVVASVAGWGVVVLVVLSRLSLGERATAWDAAHTALIVGGIVVLNLLERPTAAQTLSRPAFIGVALTPFVVAALALIVRTSPAAGATLWAAISGMATGLLVMTTKILVGEHGLAVRAYFGSPYLYVYLLFSLLSFVALQVALRRGALIAVGPVQYAAGILVPVLCAAPVFGRRLHPLQFAASLVIVYGVAGLLKKRGGEFA